MISLLDRVLIGLFGGIARAAAIKPMDLHHAVAALLIEVARRDGVIHPAEKAVITRILTERFHLPKVEAEKVIETTLHESQSTLEVFRFTGTIMKSMELARRKALIESLREVAQADGILDSGENTMIRYATKVLCSATP